MSERTDLSETVNDAKDSTARHLRLAILSMPGTAVFTLLTIAAKNDKEYPNINNLPINGPGLFMGALAVGCASLGAYSGFKTIISGQRAAALETTLITHDLEHNPHVSPQEIV